MASRNDRTRNNVLAGIFVTVAVLLGLGVVMTLKQAWTWIESSHDYTLIFSVDDGVEGLTNGSEVRVGGVPMGKVQGVRTVANEAGVVDHIEVAFTLSRDVTLYDNAVAKRVAPLLGNISIINFSSVGDPATGAVVPPDGELTAAPDLGILATFLGDDTAGGAKDIVSGVQRTIDNVEEFSEFLRDVPGDYDELVRPALTDARAIVGDAREDYGQWAERVNAAIDRGFEGVEAFSVAMEDVRAGVEENRPIIREAVANMGEAVDVNRPKLDEVMDNALALSEESRAALQDFRDVTVPKLNRGLDTAQTGLDDFAAVLDKVNEEYDVQIPGVRELLADARLAGQQLKLTTVEVRRSPWKLLYRPSTEELEYELLYEAVRTFALATADLKASVASMQRVLELHGGDDDIAVLQTVRDHLEERFENYERAQQRMLDVLLVEPGAP